MDRARAVVGGVVSSEPSKGSSGGFLTSRYSLVPMTSGGSPKRRALERFLRALDDLGAAADGLGRSDPPEQPRLPLVLVSALLAEEIEGAGCEVSVLQGAPEPSSLASALEKHPALVVAAGESGAAWISRLRELQP